MNDTLFSNQFRPLPQGKVSGGYLEVGEYNGSTYQFEGQVAFYLGPDNQVWALVGRVEDLPDQVTDLAEKANRILDEAEEAFGARSLAVERASCGGWAAPQQIADFLFWLEDEAAVQEGSGEDKSYANALRGVANELRTLGFQPTAAPWHK